MSTRSIIAIPIDGGDAWKGRYCHSDGYPTGVGKELFTIVKRDGLETAIQRLTIDRFGWSSLDSDRSADEKPWQGDGRFASEEGYGIAYTTEQGQSAEDQWLTIGNCWGTEWCYILAPGGMLIGKVDFSDNVTPVTMVPWDSEPDFDAIEQGVYDTAEG